MNEFITDDVLKAVDWIIDDDKSVDLKDIESMLEISIVTDLDVVECAENIQRIKRNSPFTNYFKDVIKMDLPGIPSKTGVRNEYYSPSAFKALQSYMHLFPLWLACVYSKLQEGFTRAANMPKQCGS